MKGNIMKINTKRPIAKACPVCGNMPIIRVEDMGEPNGRGYPGCFRYTLSCNCCKIPQSVSATTVYTDPDEIETECINKWNEEVDRIQAFLDDK